MRSSSQLSPPFVPFVQEDSKRLLAISFLFTALLYCSFTTVFASRTPFGCQPTWRYPPSPGLRTCPRETPPGKDTGRPQELQRRLKHCLLRSIGLSYWGFLIGTRSRHDQRPLHHRHRVVYRLPLSSADVVVQRLVGDGFGGSGVAHLGVLVLVDRRRSGLGASG